MNSKKIENLKNQLTDVFYGEESMTDELQTRLNDSEELKEHWNGMEFLHKNLESKVENDKEIIGRIPIEIHVQAAFANAEEVINDRLKKRQFILFLLIAFLLFTTMGMLIISGNEGFVICEQIALSIFMISITPFIIKHRQKKEGL